MPLKRLDAILLIGVILFAILMHLLPGPRTIDDAFITFRYSRNIVEGQGFVYNPGSRVLGTTTPLYTLLIAAISKVTGGEDFPWYALTINALAAGGVAGLLFLIAWRWTGKAGVGAVIGVLWGLAPLSVTFAVGGMETEVSILCMVGAVWLLILEQSIGLGIVMALGFLTRIDALIWIGPLVAYQLGERLLAGRRESLPLLKSIPWRTWFAFGITLLPWLIFSAVYFGSPFPNTVAAKTVAYVVAPGSAFATLFQTYILPFFESATLPLSVTIIAIVFYVIFTVVAIRHALRSIPRLLPFLLYPWFYMIAFSVANPLIFRWYRLPPMPALMLGIVVGAWLLIDGIQKQISKQRWIAPGVFGAVAILWIVVSLKIWTIAPDGQIVDRPTPGTAWNLIELDYQQIGTQLREKYGVTPQTRVASADIGAIGYFSRATIIDTVGLVTPALSKYYPYPPEIRVDGQNYAIPPALILDTQPDYFVTMEAFVRLGLEKDQQFKAEYGDPFFTIPTTFYGTDMRVYRRLTQ